MLHDEERLIRLKQQSSKQAIDLAMQGRWQEAVEVNKEILENFTEDAKPRGYAPRGDALRLSCGRSGSIARRHILVF